MVFLNSMGWLCEHTNVSTHTYTALPYHLPLERWLITALVKKVVLLSHLPLALQSHPL